MMWRSVRHTPHAFTCTRTWPLCGRGSGASRICSGAPGESARALSKSTDSLGADVVVAHDLPPARHLLDDPFLRRLGTERDDVHAERIGQRPVDVGKLDRLHEL